MNEMHVKINKNKSSIKLLLSTFYAFVKKEFLHVIRDRRSMLILLCMPAVMVVLFGFALSNEIRNVNVVFLIPKYDSEIQQIIDKIDASEYFTYKGMITNSSEIDGVFRKGKVDMIIAFSNHFENDVFSPEGSQIQLIADAVNPNMATAIEMYASNIIMNHFAGKSPRGVGSGVIPNIKMLYNPQIKSSYTFVPGVMGLVILLICSMMTSVSIVREKEVGTMELLLVSPVRPIIIIFSKMAPYLVLSFINFLTILFLSVILLDVSISGSFFTLCLFSLIYICTALALGLFISTVTESQIAAMIISGVVLLLPTMFFSGLLFNVESMPLIFRLISDMIPAYWYIMGVKKLMIEGLSIGYVSKELFVLLGMLLFFIVVSLKNFNRRLR